MLLHFPDRVIEFINPDVHALTPQSQCTFHTHWTQKLRLPLTTLPHFQKINMANPFHLTRLAIVVFKSSNLYVHQISHSLHIPNNNETHWNPSITRSLPVYSDLISLPKPKLSRRFPISMNRPQWLWFLHALSNDRLSACISQIIDRGSFLTGVYPPHHDRYPLIDRSDFPLYQGSG